MEDIQLSRHHLTNSTAWLLLRLCSGIFLIETAYVALIAFSLTPIFTDFHTQTLIGLWILQTVKFLLLIALVIAVVVPWASTQYYISDKQLIKYIGLAQRDEEAFDLNLLKSISLHQGWFGRVFNYGEMHLTFSSSGYHKELCLIAIYNPKKYERVLREYLATSRSQAI